VPAKLTKNIPKFNYMLSYLPVSFLAVIIVLIARDIPGLHVSSGHNLKITWILVAKDMYL
jgi:hypothetical protein